MLVVKGIVVIGAVLMGACIVTYSAISIVKFIKSI